LYLEVGARTQAEPGRFRSRFGCQVAK
jgi:hypothetical protein